MSTPLVYLNEILRPFTVSPKMHVPFKNLSTQSSQISSANFRSDSVNWAGILRF